MNAKDLMTPHPECISPDMGLEDVAQKMKTMDIGFLPVCQNERLIGTVTDRDMTLRVIAEGRDAKTMTARDVMTPLVYWCYEDESLEDIAQYMADREIRRVLILKRNKRLTGVISIGDLAKRGGEQKVGKAIRSIAEAPPARAA